MGCLTCGTATKIFASSGKFAKYCSDACMNPRKTDRRGVIPVPMRTCRGCGSSYKPRMNKNGGFCSNDCYKSTVKESLKRTCKACGIVFLKKTRTKTKGIYCSRSCAYSDQHSWHNPVREKMAPHTTIRRCGCGKYRPANRKRCESCQAKYRVAMELRAFIRGIRAGVCLWCKDEFPRVGDRSRFCCDEHRDLATKARERPRKALEKASARARNGLSKTAFDPRVVFERDGWRCQCCQCDTPSRLRGTLHDDAPELDHIVPLARGGSHTLENTQTLCRVCNILKGARDWGDFISEMTGGHRREKIVSLHRTSSGLTEPFFNPPEISASPSNEAR